MYKVIIIDDEPIVLESIKKSIQWDKLGYTVVGTFRNPIRAIEYLIDNVCDLVITDIKMPQMTGIELIKKIKQLDIKTEFMIVSGYADFHYAKEAIHLGVYDYILKPIDVNQINEILMNLKINLDNKTTQQEIITLEKMKSDVIDVKQIFPVLNEGYLVVVIKFKEKSMNLFKNISDLVVFNISHAKNMVIYLFELNNLNDVEDYIIENQKYIVSVGIDKCLDNEKSFGKTLHQALVACYCGIFTHDKKIWYYEKPSNNEILALFYEFKDMVVSNRPDVSMIDKLKKVFLQSKNPIEACVIFSVLMSQLETNKPYEKEKNFENILLQADSMLEQYQQIDDFVNYIKEYLEIQTNKKKDYAQNELLEDIRTYIENNYHQPLKLKDVADKFYINMNYLCQIFKDYYSCGFIDYLTNVRLTKAKELLANKNLTIAKISEMVGYNDHYYFIRVFSKHYNITPGKYRLKYYINE